MRMPIPHSSKKFNTFPRARRPSLARFKHRVRAKFKTDEFSALGNLLSVNDRASMDTGYTCKKDQRMEASLLAAIIELGHLNVAGLKTKYRDLFGEDSRSSNRQFLVRRIAWRLQAQAEGDLSERARGRIAEIAEDTDFRTRAPVCFMGIREPGAAFSRGAHNDFRMPHPVTDLSSPF